MSESAPPPPKRPRGRPTKYTAEIAKKICELLTLGNYFDVACLNAGIEPRTGYRWMKRKDFCQAVDKAQAEAEVFLLADVRGGSPNWQARAWMLERKFPGKWGQRVQASVRLELDEFLTQLQHGLSPEEYRRVLQVAAARFADLEAGPTSQPLTSPASGVTVAGELGTGDGEPAGGRGADGVHPPAQSPADVAAPPGAAGRGPRAS